nr:ORF2 [Lepus torque teno virus 2]
MATFDFALDHEGLQRTPSEENWLLAVICSHNSFCMCGEWAAHLRSIAPAFRDSSTDHTRSPSCGTPDGASGDGGDAAVPTAGEDGIDDATLAAALEEAEDGNAAREAEG